MSICLKYAFVPFLRFFLLKNDFRLKKLPIRMVTLVVSTNFHTKTHFTKYIKQIYFLMIQKNKYNGQLICA